MFFFSHKNLKSVIEFRRFRNVLFTKFKDFFNHIPFHKIRFDTGKYWSKKTVSFRIILKWNSPLPTMCLYTEVFKFWKILCQFIQICYSLIKHALVLKKSKIKTKPLKMLCWQISNFFQTFSVSEQTMCSFWDFLLFNWKSEIKLRHCRNVLLRLHQKTVIRLSVRQKTSMWLSTCMRRKKLMWLSVLTQFKDFPNRLQFHKTRFDAE